jgi:hypothetical protein
MQHTAALAIAIALALASGVVVQAVAFHLSIPGIVLLLGTRAIRSFRVRGKLPREAKRLDRAR